MAFFHPYIKIDLELKSAENSFLKCSDSGNLFSTIETDVIKIICFVWIKILVSFNSIIS